MRERLVDNLTWQGPRTENELPILVYCLKLMLEPSVTKFNVEIADPNRQNDLTESPEPRLSWSHKLIATPRLTFPKTDIPLDKRM
jgi:hypothetical protein